MNISLRQNPHLHDNELQSLLRADGDGELVDSNLLDHLDSCDSCRDRMERLAADPWVWQQAECLRDTSLNLECSTRSQLPGSKTNPETDNNDYAEDRVSAALAAASGADAHRQIHDSTLDQLLESPGHPEFLGRLGNYDIERVIGSGGMGVVFQAFDSQLSRPVAIKVLAPRLSGLGVARQRFAREARAIAAVCHDNVIAIHSIHVEPPNPYLVMPLVSGGNLQEFVEREGPPSVVEIVQIGKQIAAGLAAAHREGVIHRDVKPANVLLANGRNRILLTDFGLAQVENDASLTRSGLITGTPHYMSPEQARGETADAQSDVFSLGTTLYFLATGQPPVDGAHPMAVLHKICQGKFKDVRELNPEIPTELAHLIHSMIEPNPSRRISSAEQVAKLLTEYLAHLQQPTHIQRPRIRAPYSVLKKRTRKIGQFIGSLAFAALAIVLIWVTSPWLYTQYNAFAAGGTAQPSGVADSTGDSEKMRSREASTSGLPEMTATHTNRLLATSFDEQLREQITEMDSDLNAIVSQSPWNNDLSGLASIDLEIKNISDRLQGLESIPDEFALLSGDTLPADLLPGSFQPGSNLAPTRFTGIWFTGIWFAPIQAGNSTWLGASWLGTSNTFTRRTEVIPPGDSGRRP